MGKNSENFKMKTCFEKSSSIENKYWKINSNRENNGIREFSSLLQNCANNLRIQFLTTTTFRLQETLLV